jgi:hypothetical protein
MVFIDLCIQLLFLFIICLGDGLSDVTDPRGKVTQKLLKKIPYDLLTIGKH